MFQIRFVSCIKYSLLNQGNQRKTSVFYPSRLKSNTYINPDNVVIDSFFPKILYPEIIWNSFLIDRLSYRNIHHFNSGIIKINLLNPPARPIHKLKNIEKKITDIIVKLPLKNRNILRSAKDLFPFLYARNSKTAGHFSCLLEYLIKLYNRPAGMLRYF